MERPRRTRRLPLVSSGLGIEGGGTAVVGRLMLTCLSRFCARHGPELEILNMGSATPPGLAAAHRTLRASRLRLALSLAVQQLVRPPVAIVFDHLVPARVQALLPAVRRSPYLVVLYGIIEIDEPEGLA